MAAASPSPSPSPVSGSVLVLIQFDVCEELRLDQLQRAANARIVQQPKTKHSVPTYVRYHRPPVVEPLEPLLLAAGERLEGSTTTASSASYTSSPFQAIGKAWFIWPASGCGTWILLRA